MSAVYRSDLRLDECLQRLQARCGSAWAPWRGRWEWPAEGTVWAKIRGRRFRIFAQGPPYIRNSFVPFFYGRLDDKAGGCEIRGRFGIHPIVVAFMTFWFGGLGAGFVTMVLGRLSILTLPGIPPPLVVVVAPLGMMLFGIGLLTVGRRSARAQLRELERFLKHELKAQRAPDG